MNSTFINKKQAAVLFIAWLAFLVTFISRMTWAPIIPLVSEEMALTAKQAGSYMTAFFVGYVLTQLPGGLLADKFGYRKVLLYSFALIAIFTALMGTISSYTSGLVYRVLAGLGSGAVYAASIRAIFEWFPGKGRGFAMGMFFTSTSIGVMLVNLMAPLLATRYGWPVAFFVAAVIPALGLILGSLLLQEKPQLEQATSVEVNAFFQSLGELFKNKNLIITAIAGFCAMWGTWGAATWANAYMNKVLHLSLVESGIFMSLYGLAALICLPFSGILVDRFKEHKNKLVCVMVILFAFILAAFGNNHSTALLYLLAPALGIFAFIYGPPITVFAGELVEMKQVGAATGLVNTIQQIGAILSPLVVGIVLDSTQDYGLAFLALAAGPILSAIMIMLVKVDRYRESYAKKL